MVGWIITPKSSHSKVLFSSISLWNFIWRKGYCYILEIIDKNGLLLQIRWCLQKRGNLNTSKNIRISKVEDWSSLMLLEGKDWRILMSSPLNRLFQKPQNKADFLGLGYGCETTELSITEFSVLSHWYYEICSDSFYKFINLSKLSSCFRKKWTFCFIANFCQLFVIQRYESLIRYISTWVFSLRLWSVFKLIT